jgi:glycosyltransferase involved in cell wall biosynthesis
MISVLILTKNEERDLPDCLRSVSWSDDVVVFDSYSSDSTTEVAERSGARVVKRHFDNWSSHQNWGLQNIRFKYQWVLYVDADERVTPELAASLRRAVEVPGSFVAFRIQRRDFFMGRWLKHVQATPFYIRLFRPEFMRYERLVNPLSIVDGDTGAIEGYLDHFPFSKGIKHWFDRHNTYSSLEAQQIIANRAAGRRGLVGKAFISSDPTERRFHQKELFYRFPARPMVKFVLLFVFKGGFLDGRAGLTYALLQAIYEYMIVVKTNEERGTG